MVDHPVPYLRLLSGLIGLTLLTGCFDGDNHAPLLPEQGGESDSSILTSSITISGLASLSSAKITITSSNGNTSLATTQSGSHADFQAKVPDKAVYPYLLTATSGVDLVTGSPPGLTLLSVISGPEQRIANINIFTTLIVRTAQAMAGGLTQANIELARQTVIQRLGFGLDTTAIPDPITSPITVQNAADIVKAGEALAETIRRIHAALLVGGHNFLENDIIAAIAADLTDGYLDGNGAGGSRALIAAMANIVSGAVLIESLSNNLSVNGAWATDLLDGAIHTIKSEASKMTADIPINTASLALTKTALEAAKAIDSSEALSTLTLVVNYLASGTPPADVEAVLSEQRSRDFSKAISLTTSATSNQLAAINSAVRDNVSEPANDKLLALAWYSNPGEVLGYIVYFGSSPDGATTIASETSGTSVKYYTQLDLGLNPGERVCFRLKAFNLAGLSGYSGAACMTI